MAFHIKDDFKTGPVSQVPVSWYNAVARLLNGLIGGFGIATDKNMSGASMISIKRDVLKSEIENVVENKMSPEGLVQKLSEKGTPVDESIDATEALDTSGPSFRWEPGRGNGLIIDLFYNYETAGSYKTVSRCRVTISNSGLITSVQGLPERYRVC